MQHRPEIDGLRAVAVLPVILFHAGLMGPLQGGFVGVDVFFVLSGYLITAIILGEQAKGTFTVAGFYERRARRILPALVVMCLATIPFAWLLLLPFEFTQHFKALGAVAVFISNVFFWDRTGYFDLASEAQPLLHTWSLAVEEQFYLFFPLLLMALSRLSHRWLAVVLGLIALASLGLAEWGAVNKPKINFFFTPSRLWELLVGALCAIALFQRSVWRQGWLAAVGLGMIALAVAIYGPHTPFPSVYTLLPVVGTALVILFASPQTVIARLLSARFLVGIGLISYSAYLWHQPVLVFARMWSDGPLGVATLLGLVVLIFGLAWASWAFVEQPFRRRPMPVLARQRDVFRASAAALLGLMGLGLWGASTDGLFSRFSPAAREILLDYGDYRRTMGVFDLGRCFADLEQGPEVPVAAGCLTRQSDRDLILLGDSHAAHLVHGLRLAVGPDRGVVQFTAASCRPFDVPDATERCIGMRKAFAIGTQGFGPADLVLSANMEGPYEDLGKDDFLNTLRKSIDELQARGFRIVLVGQSPNFQNFAWVRRIVRLDAMPQTYRAWVENPGPLNAALAQLAREEGIGFFDMGAALCAPGDKLAQCDAVRDGRALFGDAGHFSAFGSEMIGQAMLAQGLLKPPAR